MIIIPIPNPEWSVFYPYMLLQKNNTEQHKTQNNNIKTNGSDSHSNEESKEMYQ